MAYEAVRLEDGLSYGLEAAAGLAELRSGRGGRPLLGAADGLREGVGVPIWGPRLTRFESLVAFVRGALEEQLFETLWAEGRTLGYNGALKAARHALTRATPGATS